MRLTPARLAATACAARSAFWLPVAQKRINADTEAAAQVAAKSTWAVGAALSLRQRAHTGIGTGSTVIALLSFENHRVRIARPLLGLNPPQAKNLSLALRARYGFEDGYALAPCLSLSLSITRLGSAIKNSPLIERSAKSAVRIAYLSRFKTRGPTMHHFTSATAASLLCLLALKSLASGPADANQQQALPPLQAIAALDLPRYMGTWHEIARFPNGFQKQCVGATSARYSVQDDGTVQVINRCRLNNGEFKEATGSARQIGNARSPRLEVRFAPAWLSFIPAVWGDYWVIDLDEKYQLAAISEPARDYLWVLSRSPKVDPAAYEALLARLKQQGFNIQKLLLTPQD